jgi:hypothetical protein
MVLFLSLTGRALQRLTACAILALAAGCASAPPPSPQLLSRCQRDYALWKRYVYGHDLNHTGQRARAELALYRCQTGEYHPAIETLEDILRRNKFVLPPA